MPSEPKEAYVWVWLPEAVEPVVAGVLTAGEVISFAYGQSYLERDNAIPLYDLPLVRGAQEPYAGDVHGCIADAGPDSWGQRVILNRLVGSQAQDTAELSRLTYLLESGSDRIGGLDFQASPSEYVPRTGGHAELEELAESAQRVQEGIPLSPVLDEALLHGTSIGGARPKALLTDASGRRIIAKFSSTTDTYPMVKAEFVAMELAARVGLDVSRVELTSVLGKDVLLIDRFDRTDQGGRQLMVSALTILRLSEIAGRYATYYDLADQIRARFIEPERTLRELFSRITFNILVSNNDDHARNHAAFWDGERLRLTPAYDITPHPRTGRETAQAMAIGRDGFRTSQVDGCVARASTYLLTEAEAHDIVDHQVDVINGEWKEVSDIAELTQVDRELLSRSQFLNPYSLQDYPKASRLLTD